MKKYHECCCIKGSNSRSLYCIAECGVKDTAINYPWISVSETDFNALVMNNEIQLLEWVDGVGAVGRYTKEELKALKGYGKDFLELAQKYYWDLDVNFPQEDFSFASALNTVTASVNAVMSMFGVKVVVVYFVGNIQVANYLASNYCEMVHMPTSVIKFNNMSLCLPIHVQFIDIFKQLCLKYTVKCSMNTLLFQYNHTEKLGKHFSTDRKAMSDVIACVNEINRTITDRYK